MTPAAEYNQREQREGRLTLRHLEVLIREWQRAHALVLDGMAGRQTQTSLAGAGKLASHKVRGESLIVGFRATDVAAFNERELHEGRLTWDHVVKLAGFWQARYRLTIDGMVGPLTRASIEAFVEPTMERCYPLPVLPDGRQPLITSGSRWHNDTREDHDGVDVFYPYDEDLDGPVVVGDGGAARGPDGEPQWIVPVGTRAIAAAVGVVVLVNEIPTGIRIWLQHPNQTSTGYFHLRTADVRVGQRVRMGHPLGEVWHNPVAVDARHLHFESLKGAVSGMKRDEYKAALVAPEGWLEGASYWR